MSEHIIDMMLFLAKAIDPERLLAEIVPAVPGTLIFKNGDQGPDAWADSAQLRALVSLLTMDEDVAYRTATHVLPDPVLQVEAAVLLARRRTADEIAAGAVAIVQTTCSLLLRAALKSKNATLLDLACSLLQRSRASQTAMDCLHRSLT